MTLCREIALIRQTKTNHWNHEEHLSQEEVEHKLLQVHVDPTPITLIKSKHNDKSEKDFVKLKLCRDQNSSKLDLYELKIALFGKSEPEQFFVYFKFQQDSRGFRNDRDDHEGAIPSYTCQWRSVTSV